MIDGQLEKVVTYQRSRVVTEKQKFSITGKWLFKRAGRFGKLIVPQKKGHGYMSKAWGKRLI